ncbi:hypothetical protein GCM10027287_05000 [Bordetella muralis]
MLTMAASGKPARVRNALRRVKDLLFVMTLSPVYKLAGVTDDVGNLQTGYPAAGPAPFMFVIYECALCGAAIDRVVRIEACLQNPKHIF